MPKCMRNSAILISQNVILQHAMAGLKPYKIFNKKWHCRLEYLNWKLELDDEG
jgi:hypothetical protein